MNAGSRRSQVVRCVRAAAAVGLLIAGILKAWEPWLLAATIRRLFGIDSWLAVGAISAAEVWLAASLLLVGGQRLAMIGGVVGAAFLGWRGLSTGSMSCGCFGAARGDALAMVTSALLVAQAGMFLVLERSPGATPRRRSCAISLASLLVFGVAWLRFDGEELWQVVMRERGLLEGTVAVVDPDCIHCQHYVEAARTESDLVLVVRDSVIEVARTAWPDVACVAVSEAMWWQWCGDKPPAIYRIEAGRIGSPR